MELPIPSSRHHLTRQSRITLIYLAVGLIWILVTDRFFAGLSGSIPDFLSYQSTKGVVFVLATSALLYLLLKKNFHEVEAINFELKKSYANTIKSWVRIMDARHQETRYHTERVQRMTVRFAQIAGVSDDRLHFVAWGALLHDIGKMGLDDSLLKKPGQFTPEERTEMQRHPELARQFLSGIDFLEPAINIPWCHHENWDGSGYPRGIQTEEIPLEARLFAIIDVWDALASERVYKSAWPRQEIIDYMTEQRGKKFDPGLLDLFFQNLHEIERAGHRRLPKLRF